MVNWEGTVLTAHFHLHVIKICHIHGVSVCHTKKIFLKGNKYILQKSLFHSCKPSVIINILFAMCKLKLCVLPLRNELQSYVCFPWLPTCIQLELDYRLAPESWDLSVILSCFIFMYSSEWCLGRLCGGFRYWLCERAGEMYALVM